MILGVGALLVPLVFTSACAHVENALPASKKETKAFKVIIDPTDAEAMGLSASEALFFEVDEEGKILGQKARFLGRLLGDTIFERDDKVAFKLKEEGLIENAEGRVLDAQIIDNDIEFKSFTNGARMRLSVRKGALFFSIEDSAERPSESKSLGRISPFKEKDTQQILWISHYVLLKSFELYACRAKQVLAKTSLTLLNQEQQIFHAENGRYGRSLTEIAYIKNTPYYNFEVQSEADHSFLAKATSVLETETKGAFHSREDVWTIDENGKLENIIDACR